MGHKYVNFIFDYNCDVSCLIFVIFVPLATWNMYSKIKTAKMLLEFLNCTVYSHKINVDKWNIVYEFVATTSQNFGGTVNWTADFSLSSWCSCFLAQLTP